MHDWTLATVNFDWKAARAEILMHHAGGESAIIAENVTGLSIPRRNSWGPSVSILNVEGPRPSADGTQELRIQMQSGDMISIVAGKFDLPAQ